MCACVRVCVCLFHSVLNFLMRYNQTVLKTKQNIRMFFIGEGGWRGF